MGVTDSPPRRPLGDRTARGRRPARRRQAPRPGLRPALAFALPPLLDQTHPVFGGNHVTTYRHRRCGRLGRVARRSGVGCPKGHPDLDVSVEQVIGRPAEVLLSATEQAEVLVMGSRGLGVLGGFLAGSVSTRVIARAERPVVVVRPGERVEDDRAGGSAAGRQFLGVVLGLDLSRPCDELIS
ncbi:universal stress protein [Streptomyces sp. NPDC048142]|uniref:universal stress protein n=1 Tax=Streptomyces sp. NPDC048142 TaxID=3365501 RepID=UPI0037242792